jgi:hypothetical protein
VGQKERDDTKAGAASAKVVPLWPASIRKDLPNGYLEQVARRVRANLTDLVATADSYNLDLATEFRIAADLLQKPSGTSQPLQVAESTGPSLANGTGGCWELVDHDGNALGLIVAIDGRLVLAPTTWSRRKVLAAGGAVLLAGSFAHGERWGVEGVGIHRVFLGVRGVGWGRRPAAPGAGLAVARVGG